MFTRQNACLGFRGLVHRKSVARCNYQSVGILFALRRILRLRLITCGLLLILCFQAVAQEGQWKELNEQAHALVQLGKYKEALPVAERAVQIAQVTFGNWDLRLAKSLNLLGNYTGR